MWKSRSPPILNGGSFARNSLFFVVYTPVIIWETLYESGCRQPVRQSVRKDGPDVPAVPAVPAVPDSLLMTSERDLMPEDEILMSDDFLCILLVVS